MADCGGSEALLPVAYSSGPDYLKLYLLQFAFGFASLLRTCRLAKMVGEEEYPALEAQDNERRRVEMEEERMKEWWEAREREKWFVFGNSMDGWSALV